MRNERSGSLVILGILAIFVLGSGLKSAAYDPNWTKSQCDNYSLHGLKETYYSGTGGDRGWVDNDYEDGYPAEGVDCSAYVARCLALPDYVAEGTARSQPYNTLSFYCGLAPNLLQVSDVYNLEQWDIWVWRDLKDDPCNQNIGTGHMGLFKEYDGSYIITREAQDHQAGDDILEKWRSKASLIDHDTKFLRRKDWGGATTGTVIVNATLNGEPWSGYIGANVDGPGGAGLSIAVVPYTLPSQPVGTWTVTYVGGGPSGGGMPTINPAPTQTLVPGGTITFTLAFETWCPAERGLLQDCPPGSFSKSSPPNNASGQATSLTLSWGESTYATNYKYCLVPIDGGSCDNWTSAGTALSATVGGVSPGITYVWQVCATNAIGTTYANGASNAYWSFSTTESLCSLNCSASGPSAGSVGDPVSFQSSAIPSGECVGEFFYSWTFGDGGTSPLQYPIHTYTSPGNYTWTMTASIQGVSCATETGQITISAGCVFIECTANVSSTGSVGAWIPFNADSIWSNCTGSPAYHWDFGDGTTSDEHYPSHLYNTATTYYWTVTATRQGVICSVQGHIHISEGCSLNCTASAPSSGSVNTPVFFQATATPSGGCTGEVTYRWTFGDGGASALQYPGHSYDFPGSYTWTMTATVQGISCTTQTGTITISSGCSITCTASGPSSGSVGVPVSFQATANPTNCSGNPTYHWVFGDGEFSEEQYPTHTYTAVGYYYWFMTTYVDGLGCTKPGTITISEGCSLNCTASAPSSGSVNTPVFFQATATPSGGCTGEVTYRWTFGDGGASALQYPGHSYDFPGSYTWTMTATVQGISCTTQTGTITISSGCSITCTASGPSSGSVGVPVSFQAMANPTNCSGSLNYCWNFGDGSTSGQRDPIYTYSSPGSYIWSMTATVQGVSCTTRTGTITISSGCSIACTASAPPTGVMGESVAFRGNAIPSNCTESPYYFWSFGDGATSIEQNPTHIYEALMSFTWSLTTSIQRVQCTKTGTITISGCSLTCTASAPPTGVVGESVSFRGNATSTNCTESPYYFWSFGDGATSIEQNPTHIYEANQTFTWTMSATLRDVGCTTQRGSITISTGCSLACTATAPAMGIVGTQVYFEATAAPSAECTGGLTYDWNFGDDQASTQQYPSHTYTYAGTFNWSMTATIQGVTCTHNGSITISPSCSLTCTASGPTTGSVRIPVSFLGAAVPDNCSGDPTYYWDFGDGSTSGQRNPTYTYSSAGIYYWSMTVTVQGASCIAHGSITILGCSLTCTATAPTTGVAGDQVYFEATAAPSGGCTGELTYDWNFGDGQASTQQHPGHIYTYAGTFNWSMTAKIQDMICTQSGSISISQACSLTCTSFAPATGVAGTPVSFEATAIPSNCTGSLTYYWNFGDGQSSTQQNPSHTYAFSATFSWMMEATIHGVACTQTGSITISARDNLTCILTVPATVSQGATANITVEATENESLSWYRIVITGPESYRYSDDNATGAFVWTVPSRGNSGFYTVEAIAWDTYGNVSQPVSKVIEVKDVTKPIIYLTSPSNGTLLAPNDIVNINWNASDDSGMVTLIQVRIQGQLESVYDQTFNCQSSPFNWAVPGNAKPGNFTIQATAFDAEGNSQASSIVTITIVSRCSLACSTSAAPNCGFTPMSVTFSSTASPVNCSGPMTFEWEFGDGYSSTRQNPTHIYDTEGTYIWTLAVNANGYICSSSGTAHVCAIAPLAGDCDRNNEVSIGEVQKTINMFLGTLAPDCGVDNDANGIVAIGEVQVVVNMFLGYRPPSGCTCGVGYRPF